MGQQVVVWDPTARYAEGEIVEGQKAELLALHKAALLPVVPDLLARNGTAGWVKRSWGRGVAFDPMVARRGAAVALYVLGGVDTIHWCARIKAECEGATLAGTLRLSPDSSQVGTIAGGLGRDTPPVDVAALGPADAFGGWTIGGRSKFAMQVEGLVGLSLFGSLTGGRVVWLAASQAP